MGSWTKHISNITARAGHKLGALRKVANKLNVVGRAAVYKAQVRSVMEYSWLCWMRASSTTLKVLDSIQSKALSKALVDLNIPSLHHKCRRVAATPVQNAHLLKSTKSEADAASALCS